MQVGRWVAGSGQQSEIPHNRQVGEFLCTNMPIVRAAGPARLMHDWKVRPADARLEGAIGRQAVVGFLRCGGYEWPALAHSGAECGLLW